MSSSKIVMVLGLLFLGSFALPWLDAGAEKANGYELIQLWLQGESTQLAAWMLIVPAIGALLLVILGAMGKGHGIVAFLTALSFGLFAAAFYFGNQDSSLSGGIGAWIAIGVAVLLLIFAFTKSDSKLHPPALR